MPRRLIAALATAAVVLAGASVASAAHWEFSQTDADPLWDAVHRDADGNGTVDDLWVDLDNDGAWDTHLFNTRGTDALLEAATYDMDENGVPTFGLRDADQRVGFDYVLVDWNQDGRWDVRRIIPGSNLDYRTRINTNNANWRLLHAFRMQTGQSLLFPTLRPAY
jgi:hypothetical protein